MTALACRSMPSGWSAAGSFGPRPQPASFRSLRRNSLTCWMGSIGEIPSTHGGLWQQAELVATKRTDDGLPVHSFRSLIADLATVTRNTMTISKVEDATFVLYPKLTATQQRAFEILAVPMNCCQ